MSEWKECKLLDVALKFAMGPFGSNIKAENFTTIGVPVIRGTNLNFFRFVGGDFVYLTEEKADKLKSSNCYPGDIVITHRGTLGQVCLIPDGKYKRYVISQSGMKVTPNQDYLCSQFLLYFFKSDLGQHELLQHESQVGVPSISNPLTSLKSVSLKLPPLQEQKAIASVLSSLDDKIDLLHRQNKTLEAMAETLFRQWFIEEAKEDWEEGVLSDVAFNPKDSITPLKISADCKYVGLEHIERRDIALNEHGFGRDVSSNKFIFKNKDILFGKLRPYFHKVCFAPFDGICSTDILVIRPKNTDLFAFCLFAFFQNDVVEFANLGSGGTRMPRTDWTTLKSYPIVLPDSDSIKKFNNVVVKSLEKITNNIVQIRTLENLRNTLLPKLMNGEIKVSLNYGK